MKLEPTIGLEIHCELNTKSKMFSGSNNFYTTIPNTNISVISDWVNKYEKYSIKGLESKTGKKKGGTKGQGARKSKNREEELERKIMRLEIENARLKKGYLVKGGGDQKEYVTTLDENMK